jgi:phospholipid/cholesterol/gamma-HCH transport system ATP-binding protein
MIKFRNVHKSFAAKEVLRGIDLDIRQGETVVIIGQSGSGKSVLLKHLIGLMKPDEGEILVDGVSISNLDDQALLEHRNRFGMLFQGGALFDSLTVAENVAFGLQRFTSRGKDEIARQVKKSLSLVGLKDIEHLLPHELSGGMKKRVALARAIAYEPEIILYDEPSTGIDPIRADAINDLINLMKRELSATSLVITHDMVSAYKVADKIAMLYEGRIVMTGTPDEIRETDNQVVQQFIHGRAEGPILNY